MTMRYTLLLCAGLAVGGCASGGQVTRGTDWDGMWSGIGDQGGFTYRVEITISGSTYAIDYPTLPCAGTLTLVNEAGDRRLLDESITTGNCGDRGRVVLVRSGDQMSYEWFHQPGDQRPAVTSTLTFGGR